jgi:hypothetical protein
VCVITHPVLLTPEVARARAEVKRAEEAERLREQQERAALLEEVAAFMRNHADVTIVPPWDCPGGGEMWRVEVAGMHSEYDDPQFMLTQLCERWGFSDDL